MCGKRCWMQKASNVKLIRLNCSYWPIEGHLIMHILSLLVGIQISNNNNDKSIVRYFQNQLFPRHCHSHTVSLNFAVEQSRRFFFRITQNSSTCYIHIKFLFVIFIHLQNNSTTTTTIQFLTRIGLFRRTEIVWARLLIQFFFSWSVLR